MPIMLIIVGVLAAFGVGAYLFTNQSPTVTPVTTTETPMATPATATTPDITTETADTTTDASDYTDGTYTASATYMTPKRTEHTVAISLTLVNDIITESTIQFDDKAAGETSNDNQARFADAYTTLVVGQSLDTVSLARVGGASLTSTAWNEAKAKIAAEAQS